MKHFIFVYDFLGKQMKVNVILTSGRKVTVNISSSEKVTQVIRKIEKMYGENVQNQVMSNNGNELNSEDFLSEQGVTDGAELVLSGTNLKRNNREMRSQKLKKCFNTFII